mmetsp:Transcript_9470/g.26922  ORF Transcript_9470/g.26922 Transcript_9470/m.26922 type:complete len:117 (+) Transcript_9470:1-351(+)
MRKQSDWLADRMTTGSTVGLTEKEVDDIRSKNKSKTVREREIAEMWDPSTSKTIKWWSVREEKKEKRGGTRRTRSKEERLFNVFSWKAKKTISSLRGKRPKSFLNLLNFNKYKTSG